MARIPSKLECPVAAVEPGGRLTCHVRVYNGADRVDELSARFDGPLAPFATVSPQTLPLLPETEGLFSVLIDLPADAAVESGEQHLLIKAVSGLPDLEPALEELSVDVGRRTGATLDLVARPDPGPAHQQAYEARVASTSNHPLRLVVEAEARVGAVVDPGVLEVAPFGRASALVTVDRAGDEQPVELAVRVTGDGVDLADTATWSWTPPAPPDPRPSPRPPEPPLPPPPTPPEPGGCLRTTLRIVVVIFFLIGVAVVGLAGWIAYEIWF